MTRTQITQFRGFRNNVKSYGAGRMVRPATNGWTLSESGVALCEVFCLESHFSTVPEAVAAIEVLVAAGDQTLQEAASFKFLGHLPIHRA